MQKKSTIIAPSILSADFARLGEQVQQADTAGADWIHVDVMDGRFVPNITMGPLVVKALRRVTDLPLDVHLMIIEPDHLVPAFAQAGADHITVHYEACRDLYRTLNLIKEQGCKASVAINPHTPATALSEVLPIISQVTLMTVSPGFGGQSLIKQTLLKAKQLRSMAANINATPLDIVADGGVNRDTLLDVTSSGCNVLVMGSAIFNERPIAENIQSVQDILQTE